MQLSNQKVKKLNTYASCFTTEIICNEFGLKHDDVYVDFAPIFLMSSEFVMIINDNLNNKIIALHGIKSAHCFEMIINSYKLKEFIRHVLSDFLFGDDFFDVNADEQLECHKIIMTYKACGDS